MPYSVISSWLMFISGRYTKRLTNDLPLAHELHQEKEIYELVYEAKLEKQAINAHNVRVLSFYLTKTICDDKLKVTISDQGKC